MSFMWLGLFMHQTAVRSTTSPSTRRDQRPNLMRVVAGGFAVLLGLGCAHEVMGQGFVTRADFPAEERAILSWSGESGGDFFGNRCLFAGDVNNDGIDDILIGARFNDAGGSQSGRAYVVSGADGSLLHVWTGEGPGDELAHRIATPGDLDGDGHADLIAAAYLNDTPGDDAGRVYVFSGDTGDTLYVLQGNLPGEIFGHQTRTLPDTDQDQRTDLMISVRSDEHGSETGKVMLFSGAEGSERFSVFGEAAFDHFGFRIRDAGDVDNDGINDILVGAPDNDENGASAGRAYVYSGADGDLIWTFTGENPGDRFGERLAAAGDVNRDNHDDILVGSLEHSAYGSRTGRAYLFSGKTGELLQFFTGEAAGDEFCDRMVGLGNVDGDGYDDFAICAPLNDERGQNAGKVYVYSGRTRTLIYTMYGESADDRLGRSIIGPGDLNEDGFDDVLIAAWRNDAGGTHAGRLFAYSGRTGFVLYTITGENSQDYFSYTVDASGDINDDGTPDLVVSATGHADSTGRVYTFISYPLSLAPIHFIRGRVNDLAVHGTLAHEKIYFGFSRQGTGPGPSIPGFGGLTLDLLTPVNYLGAATADTNGIAVLSQYVPPGIAEDRVYIQAVAQRGPAGSGSVKSNPITVDIF